MTTKLKLSSVPDDKPVKLSVELPPDVHRDLLDYAGPLASFNLLLRGKVGEARLEKYASRIEELGVVEIGVVYSH